MRSLLLHLIFGGQFQKNTTKLSERRLFTLKYLWVIAQAFDNNGYYRLKFHYFWQKDDRQRGGKVTEAGFGLQGPFGESRGLVQTMVRIQLYQMEKKMQFEFDNCVGDQDETSYLFPSEDSHLEESIEMLSKCYRHDRHGTLLANFCYRCHHPAIYHLYSQFKDQYHPEVTEPPISTHYPNHNFIDLRELTPHLGTGPTPSQCQSNAVLPQSVKQILDELFYAYGYIPHLERYLLFYPAYLEQKYALEQSLFQECKINKQVAFFLAFCGASELGCVYLMGRYFKLFKQAGGDPSWINAGAFPSKYKPLLELNCLMARAIWEISQNTITDILQKGSCQWNQSELAYCIEILAYVHHLSVIALAMGFNLEEPIEDYQLDNFKKLAQTIGQFQGRGSQEENKLEKVSESTIPSLNEIVECTVPLTKKAHMQEQVKPYMKLIGQQLAKQQLYYKIKQLMPHSLAPFRLIEKRREHLYPVVESSDYNFNFMAYPLLNSLTQTPADRLRSLIQHALDMLPVLQKQKRNSSGAKTGGKNKQFRKAMVHYVQNLCGYRHMEYDYKSKFATFLSMPLKFYLRLLMTSPAHITSQVVEELSEGTDKSQGLDLGNIAILIASVKLSLELTLTMKAFESC